MRKITLFQWSGFCESIFDFTKRDQKIERQIEWLTGEAGGYKQSCQSAAERAAGGKKGGPFPRRNRMKERDCRLLGLAEGGGALIRRKSQNQRPMKRGDIGATGAIVPG